MGPDAIAERANALYGQVDWTAATGLLHVASIHGPSSRTLAIGSASPPSPTDRFVLGLARARADVLVTTGSILRAEPDLVHRYAEQVGDDRAMGEWRRRVLGAEAPPRLLVLSATGRFRTDHPAFVSGAGWIWTTQEGARGIGDPPPGFMVVEAPRGRDSAAHAVAWLREERLDTRREMTILLEAGPSTTRAFYQENAAAPLDELLLSRFEGTIPEAAEGPPFVSAEAREALLGAARSSSVVEEPSGRWIFERLRCA